MTADGLPGVFINEVSARARPIALDTCSTAAFVGRVSSRWTDGTPRLITSVSDFRRLFPSRGRNVPPDVRRLGSAVREFFRQGGTRLVIGPVPGGPAAAAKASDFIAAIDHLADVTEVGTIAVPTLHDALAPIAAERVQRELSAQADSLRDRIAIVEPPPGQTLEQVRAWREWFASGYTVAYWPWISVEWVRRRELIAPSSVAAGIWARTDATRGFHAPPANESVAGAFSLEADVDEPAIAVLAADGINPVRALAGRGVVLWGARTLSPEPDWAQLRVRRTATAIERSILRGLEWVVFEPNAMPLWQMIVTSITEFLVPLWRQGALLGTTPDQAFFVRCDPTTMTQADINSGRLIALVGLALTRPAEFVTLRLQWNTATA